LTPAGTIAVCMATYEPDRELLRTQVESLRAQTEENWICLISDDGSSPEAYAALAELVGDDGRFTVSRAQQRRGFYRNFERALSMVPADVALIALCDQDDRWHPDKLAALRAGLGDAVLVYSDQRLTTAGGRVLRETMWQGRANNHRSLASMLIANTITGAATLFRRELFDVLLPFPDTPGFQFHDTWLAVVALGCGRVEYVDRPLYDYVQHPGAVFGDVTHGRRDVARRGLASPSEVASAWRAAYLYGYRGRAAQAATLLERGGPRLAPGKRRALERFVSAERSWPALVWLALRPARALVGQTETLATELVLVRGLVWKRLSDLAERHPRLFPAWLRDTTPPPPERYSEKRLRAWRARV
jgi:glycosyltransferase involved in cell wall biosynthesis